MKKLNITYGEIMSEYIFVFDLDSTITRQEILPTISEKIGRQKEMREITEATMRGEIPFKTSFLKRVQILSKIDVSEVNYLVEKIQLNEEMVKFITENKERCYIVTGNLDVWISALMKKIKMTDHVFCSKAILSENRISKVISVIDKELVARQFVQPLVVVGDGDNDSGIARYAEIAIGYGGVRAIASSLLENIDYAFFDDKKCADFLRTLL